MISIGEKELAFLFGLGASTYFCYDSIRALRRKRRLQRHGETTEGVVIGLVPVYSSEDPAPAKPIGYAARIRFRTRLGAEVVVGHGYSWLTEWQLGQRVPLRYLLTEPEQFYLLAEDHSTDDWIYVRLLLSACAVVFSLLYYYWS